MVEGKTLCLNMIVKNEMANLERCLGAVAPHIACWVIGDTGSTDGTQEFIKSFFAERGIPGELHELPFRQFRAGAKRRARLRLRLAAPVRLSAVRRRGHGAGRRGPGLPRQAGGAGLPAAAAKRLSAIGTRGSCVATPARAITASRTNISMCRARTQQPARRLVQGPRQRRQPGGQVRARHPAVDRGAEDGAREPSLLVLSRAVLPRRRPHCARRPRPTPSGRRWAAGTRRRGMPGCSRRAACATSSDEGGFLARGARGLQSAPAARRAALRPGAVLSRARHERGERAVLEAGLALPRPEQDILFLEDFVYAAGLHEEYSIAANYARDPARKDRGFAACNWLALNRDDPGRRRATSRGRTCSSIVEPVSAMMPSFAARPVGFTPPDGYRPMNPSVARLGRPDRDGAASRQLSRLTEVGQPVSTRRTARRSRRAISCCG